MFMCNTTHIYKNLEKIATQLTSLRRSSNDHCFVSIQDQDNVKH